MYIINFFIFILFIMGHQNKRTMKKYNRSRRKNNTRRKTHKKRVRKTNKKRVRTRKRMKGGSLQEGLTSGEDTRSFFQKTAQSVRNLFTPGKVDESPQSDDSISASQYQLLDDPISSSAAQAAPVQVAPAQATLAQVETQQAAPAQAVQPMSDEELANNQELVNALSLLIDAQFKKTNPELAAKFIKSLETQQSEPQKKQLIINYAKVAAPYLFATGLFQPHLLAGALGGLGLTVAAAAVGKLIAFLGSKAGKAAFEAGKAATALFGSTKDKLKLEALTLKIKNCLKTLVDYSVISNTAKDQILKKLRENTGYATEITSDYNKRKYQRTARGEAKKKKEDNHKQGYFSLNVGGTPETVVSTVPQQIPETTSTTNDGALIEGSGDYFKGRDLDKATAPDTTTSPQMDLLDIAATAKPTTTPENTNRGAFDFLVNNVSPAGGFGVTPQLDGNLNSISSN
jgi:hypothetical protein